MAKLVVAVIYGGRSSEHEVSCNSAKSVVAHLDPDKYEILPVRIGTTGHWMLDDDATVTSSSDSPLQSMLRVLDRIRSVDVVFPCLHGRFGEDGAIQGVFESLDIPYVGSGISASAASLDKEFTKKLLAAEGLAVADSVTLRDSEDTVGESDRERLGLPVFVKPARGGSSIGVSRVSDWAALPEAIRVARDDDDKVLVEASLAGREIDLGVLEHPDGRLEVGRPLEIRVAQSHDFFDYDAKYQDTDTVFDFPELDPEMADELERTAKKVFRVIECAGLLRVDFFVTRSDDGRVTATVNEVNTMPGMTAASQFPKMWQAAGMPYERLLDILIATALQRHRTVGVAG